MRILHVVAGLARSGGGLSELVPAFAREAAKRGHEVVLATVAWGDEELSSMTGKAMEAGVKVIRFAPTPPRRLFFSLSMLRGLRRLVEQADVVHVHSNWTFPVWRACGLALRNRKVLVMSPQGCLEPERLIRSALKKRVAGRLFDRRYLSHASVIHVTAPQEAEGVQRYVPGRPNVAVIPNGVDIGALSGSPDRAALDARWPECRGKKVILFMSRIHPLKGVDLLIQAWARLAAGNSAGASASDSWRLLIAGPDEGGCEGGFRRLARDLGLAEQVTFCGPLYGADKAMALRNAELFVLPSHNENFGIVVAEALACGVPVITTKGTPWAELENCEKCVNALMRECVNDGEENQAIRQSGSQAISPVRAGWWIDVGVEPLANALRAAMSLTDAERRAMGENGRRLVAERYQWGRVAERMEEVYGKCLNAETP